MQLNFDLPLPSYSTGQFLPHCKQLGVDLIHPWHLFSCLCNKSPSLQLPRAYQITNQFFRRMSKWLHLLHDVEDALEPLSFDILRICRLFGVKLLYDAHHQLMLAFIARVLFLRDLVPMTLQPHGILQIAKYTDLHPKILLIALWYDTIYLHWNWQDNSRYDFVSTLSSSLFS